MDTVQQPLQNCQGISLHKGSSFIEVLYVPKDKNVIEKEKTSSWLEHFGLTRCTFAATQLGEAVKHLKQHAQDSTKGGILEIRTTGIDNVLLKSSLEKDMNVRFINLPELECFARGFTYLNQNVKDASAFLERGTLDHRAEIQGMKKHFLVVTTGHKNKLGHLEMTKARGKLGPEEFYSKSPLLQKTASASDSDATPCLLVVCSSQITLLKVYQCGRYELIDTESTGVALFRRLGRLLSGCGSLEELAQMAAEGDARQVDWRVSDLFGVLGNTDDAYAHMKKVDPPDEVIFFFGKTTGKSLDDFKKADVIRALTQLFANDVAQLSIQVAAANKIQDVVYCGSLFENQLFKDVFAAWFMKKRVIITVLTGEVADLNLHFFRHGSCIEPFGALLCKAGRHM